MVGLEYLKMEEVPADPDPQDAAPGRGVRAARRDAHAARRRAGARHRTAVDAPGGSGAGGRRVGRGPGDGTADVRRACRRRSTRRARRRASAAWATASTPAPETTRRYFAIPGAAARRPSRRSWRSAPGLPAHDRRRTQDRRGSGEARPRFGGARCGGPRDLCQDGPDVRRNHHRRDVGLAPRRDHRPPEARVQRGGISPPSADCIQGTAHASCRRRDEVRQTAGWHR